MTTNYKLLKEHDFVSIVRILYQNSVLIFIARDAILFFTELVSRWVFVFPCMTYQTSKFQSCAPKTHGLGVYMTLNLLLAGFYVFLVHWH